jgi:hypothetical protein
MQVHDGCKLSLATNVLKELIPFVLCRPHRLHASSRIHLHGLEKHERSTARACAFVGA